MQRSPVLVAAPLAALLLGPLPAAGGDPDRPYGPHPGPRGWAEWLSPRARIGVRVQPMSAELREYFEVEPDHGVLVDGVEPESPAAQAGLRAGDVILSADGEPVRAPRDLVRAIHESSGGAVVLEVSRKGSRERIEVVPGPPPPPPHERAWEEMRPWVGEGVRELRERLEDVERRLHELEQSLEKREPGDRG